MPHKMCVYTSRLLRSNACSVRAIESVVKPPVTTVHCIQLCNTQTTCVKKSHFFSVTPRGTFSPYYCHFVKIGS